MQITPFLTVLLKFVQVDNTKKLMELVVHAYLLVPHAMEAILTSAILVLLELSWLTAFVLLHALKHIMPQELHAFRVHQIALHAAIAQHVSLADLDSTMTRQRYHVYLTVQASILLQ